MTCSLEELFLQGRLSAIQAQHISEGTVMEYLGAHEKFREVSENEHGRFWDYTDGSGKIGIGWDMPNRRLADKVRLIARREGRRVMDLFVDLFEMEHDMQIFETDEDIEELDFRECKKTALAEAVQIDRPFRVETMEGVFDGKPGDYLMRGVDEELYVCDQEVFRKSYEFVDEDE